MKHQLLQKYVHKNAERHWTKESPAGGSAYAAAATNDETIVCS